MLLGKEALGVQRNAEDQLRRLQAFTHSAPVLIAEPFQHTLLHIRDGKVGGNHYCNQCRGEDERLAQKACMNLVCRWHGMTWQCGPYSPHLLRFPIQLLPTNNMCRQDPHEGILVGEHVVLVPTLLYHRDNTCQHNYKFITELSNSTRSD